MDVASTLSATNTYYGVNTTKPNSPKQFNPQTALINTNDVSVQVDLSREALEFLSGQSENSGADFGALNLSKKDQDRLNAIDKKIESLFTKSEKGKLTKDEESELNKLLKESDEILFKNELDNTPGLSKEDKKNALNLFKQIGEILDKYGFEKSPSKEDEKKLTKLTDQLDKIFDKSEKASFESELSEIPGLSKKDKKTALNLFKQIETILEKFDTDGASSKNNEKKLETLTEQLDTLLGYRVDNVGKTAKDTNASQSVA